MLAVIGKVELLVAVKAEISPDPPEARPMAVLELVQLYVVPGTLPENWTGVASVFWHKTWFTVAFTVGMGLIVIVNDEWGPEH